MILNQVTLPAIDYQASVAFFRRLGPIEIVDAPPRYARAKPAYETPPGTNSASTPPARTDASWRLL